nr:hypothetical protein Iba_chr11fCG11960 [Ipomoea batatas]
MEGKSRRSGKTILATAVGGTFGGVERIGMQDQREQLMALVVWRRSDVARYLGTVLRQSLYMYWSRVDAVSVRFSDFSREDQMVELGARKSIRRCVGRVQRMRYPLSVMRTLAENLSLGGGLISICPLCASGEQDAAQHSQLGHCQSLSSLDAYFHMHSLPVSIDELSDEVRREGGWYMETTWSASDSRSRMYPVAEWRVSTDSRSEACGRRYAARYGRPVWVGRMRTVTLSRMGPVRLVRIEDLSLSAWTVIRMLAIITLSRTRSHGIAGATHPSVGRPLCCSTIVWDHYKVKVLYSVYSIGLRYAQTVRHCQDDTLMDCVVLRFEAYRVSYRQVLITGSRVFSGQLRYVALFGSRLLLAKMMARVQSCSVCPSQFIVARSCAELCYGIRCRRRELYAVRPYDYGFISFSDASCPGLDLSAVIGEVDLCRAGNALELCDGTSSSREFAVRVHIVPRAVRRRGSRGQYSAMACSKRDICADDTAHVKAQMLGVAMLRWQAVVAMLLYELVPLCTVGGDTWSQQSSVTDDRDHPRIMISELVEVDVKLPARVLRWEYEVVSVRGGMLIRMGDQRYQDTNIERELVVVVPQLAHRIPSRRGWLRRWVRVVVRRIARAATTDEREYDKEELRTCGYDAPRVSRELGCRALREVLRGASHCGYLVVADVRLAYASTLVKLEWNSVELLLHAKVMAALEG